METLRYIDRVFLVVCGLLGAVVLMLLGVLFFGRPRKPKVYSPPERFRPDLRILPPPKKSGGFVESAHLIPRRRDDERR